MCALSICGARGKFITFGRKRLSSASFLKCPVRKCCIFLVFISPFFILFIIKHKCFNKVLLCVSKVKILDLDFRSHKWVSHASVKCGPCWIFYGVTYSHLKKNPVWHLHWCEKSHLHRFNTQGVFVSKAFYSCTSKMH